jgi:hypothetical protein
VKPNKNDYSGLKEKMLELPEIVYPKTKTEADAQSENYAQRTLRRQRARADVRQIIVFDDDTLK